MTGYVCIYNNPVLLSPGSAFHGIVTMTGHCSVYGHVALATRWKRHSTTPTLNWPR